MNDVETSSRIDAMETRIAYQDRIIEELNTAITEQWKQIESLTRQVERMADRLQQVADNASPNAPEPPPPHY
jgi:SlyX protein